MSERTCCPPGQAPEPASCCPPEDVVPSGCCPTPGLPQRPGYALCPFVTGACDSPAGVVPRVAGSLTWSDRLGHWAMRWGIGRKRYAVAPGLYAAGSPDENSPVVVTANYKMSFDLVRRDLAGHDCWLLVLDTGGINVWCAAGKGSFGTAELVRRIADCGLVKVVGHRRLILPQLGAVGVSAHEVLKQSGFRVCYGPIRSRELPAFLAADCTASEAMRSVTFTLWERTVLTPVELTLLWKKAFIAVVALLIVGGIGSHWFSLGAALHRGGAAVAAGLVSVVVGAVVVPILLPWLPGRSFAFKGAVAGGTAALLALLLYGGSLGWLNGTALLCFMPPTTSYLAMNFTGSTPFTSPSGVEQEMRTAIPMQCAALVAALALWLIAAF